MYEEIDEIPQLSKLRKKWDEGWVELAQHNRDTAQSEFDASPSRTSFTVLLESISEGAVLADGSGMIVYSNGHADQLFGYDRGQMVGRSVEDLVPDYARARHQELRATYALEPKIRPMGVGMDLEGRRADGSTFPVEVSLSVLDDGEDRLFMALVSDISERKQQEAALVQAGKFAAIGELAGNIAHEVNNPIGIISAKARLMLSTEAETLSEKARSDLEKIIEQCDRLGKLTRGLLDFSRPSLGEKTRLQLHQPLRSALGMVGDRAQKYRIELLERLFATEECILGNANELQQVFLNLCINAIDAMPDGGRLCVSTETVASKGCVEVLIEDTGSGMPDEVREQIFEPFFTTKGNKGTGLGLSICLGLVRSHGGTISVESYPGQGTTFRLRFPLFTP